ncbi:hypothetical protein NDU88_003909 [Pleurodeles waltl]|uniref:Secreted protein n=1 Tax=Pleurodeles waltl TaxID=8319 RepID=A0AAV7TSM1_PLEWA|nr:hypothetical protein NDU88_003909 [Pleurodeles waltl]
MELGARLAALFCANMYIVLRACRGPIRRRRKGMLDEQRPLRVRGPHHNGPKRTKTPNVKEAGAEAQQTFPLLLSK